MIAVIRTFVQVALAWFVAMPPIEALITWLTDVLGMTVNLESIAGWLTAISTGVVVGIVTWAGKRWPIINQIISLGRSKSLPTYV